MESYNSKILLFGEYTVLHNGMALVVPCDLYSGRLNFYEHATNKKYALQSNEYLKKLSGFIASHVDDDFVLEVKQFEKEIENGLFFQSNIPQGYGLGSSGALVVAIFLRYLKKAKTLKDDLKVLTFEKIGRLKNSLGKIESFFHGVSSGLDPLSIILNEPILFKNANDIITTSLPEKKSNGENVIFLLNTHIPRSTSGLMSRFSSLHEQPVFKKQLSENLVVQNNRAIESFLSRRNDEFYDAIYRVSRFQLEEMHDFIPSPIQAAVQSGITHGDYFLKLCGAGGGGFMLGFTKDWEKTQQDLRDYDIRPIYQY